MSKPDFVQGVYVEASDKDFVIVKQRVNVQRFQEFLNDSHVQQFAKKNNGYINMDVLRSKNGKLYIPFNEFIPEKKVTTTEHNPDRELDEVPF
jgi:hypothetical protein